MRKTIVILVHFLIGYTFFAHGQQKMFGHTQDNWQYTYPFADKSYALAVEHYDEGNERKINVYFGRKKGGTEVVYWKEIQNSTKSKRDFKYVDYNNDGVKDLIFFVRSGARGGNSYYLLYLIDPKKHTLSKVKDFEEEIPNPTYNKKNKVIVGLGLVGDGQYYVLYRINKANKLYQIGGSFKETEDLDLDAKIKQTLKKKQ